MTTYIWAIDTPWAKKGTEYKEFSYSELGSIYFNTVKIGDLLDIGWIKPVEDKKQEISVDYSDGDDETVLMVRIPNSQKSKPVEDKKLTEEEILEAIEGLKRRVEVLEKQACYNPNLNVPYHPLPFDFNKITATC